MGRGLNFWLFTNIGWCCLITFFQSWQYHVALNNIPQSSSDKIKRLENVPCLVGCLECRWDLLALSVSTLFSLPVKCPCKKIIALIFNLSSFWKFPRAAFWQNLCDFSITLQMNSFYVQNLSCSWWCWCDFSLSVLAGCNYVSKTRVLYHVLSDTLFLSLVCS